MDSTTEALDSSSSRGEPSPLTASNVVEPNESLSPPTGTVVSEASLEATAVPESPSRSVHDVLNKGDLVRISESAALQSRRLKDRKGQLGRVHRRYDDNGEVLYDVDFVLGGKLNGLRRDELDYTSADLEGMTDEGRNRRKRKPANLMDDATNILGSNGKKQSKIVAATEVTSQTEHGVSAIIQSKRPIKKASTGKSASKTLKPKGGATTESKVKNTNQNEPPNKTKKRKLECAAPAAAESSTSTTALDLYEKHRREFERIYARLEKVDKFGYFLDEAPDEFVEVYDGPGGEGITAAALCDSANVGDSSPSPTSALASNGNTIYPSHPPYNWEMIRRRMKTTRYALDREKLEERERFALLAPYYNTLPKKRRPRMPEDGSSARSALKANTRVLYSKGVHWDLFRDDVLGMCEMSIARETDEDDKAVLVATASKIKEHLLLAHERTGKRHAKEMQVADDRRKFALALEKQRNTEAAMQSWKKVPFPERKYERLAADIVCAGLSQVDEGIASYELKTNLPDSFVGLSYRYDDTGQSESWMKSVVDETEANMEMASKTDHERQAALALAADSGVTRAQVVATMQSLLIAVQDRVMTEQRVLRQPELKSANWFAESRLTEPSLSPSCSAESLPSYSDLSPDIVEQPVWGIDCYTRRNIAICLETEFDPPTALVFIEKWLLPAINACPVNLAHDISMAARLLEGLPLDSSEGVDSDNNFEAPETNGHVQSSQTLLGRALADKIRTTAPPWLKGAANQIRRARIALGPDFFRVHPKGHGSVLLSSKIAANRLVTFYRGEIYPSWRWGEKMDAIELTQQRKNLKPALPDFYNMALERPQMDPRGYGLLFVDASRKAGHGSSLSHSCAPTCEVRVAAVNGELCLSMTTLREMEMGEELTFDYNAVTESLIEYRSAVCLCGYGKCRGSFLHFATADCYQQVLNRNAPIATRFSNLVKGSMKKIMSDDDEHVLRNHGFRTAAFGAISVNRRTTSNSCQEIHLEDSTDVVPVWLRTFVADTLRYIEYERRALPIALICDHFSNEKKVTTGDTIPSDTTQKEPGREPIFFFFFRMEREFFLSLLKKEGIPETAKGIYVKQALLKVASGYWQALSEDKKQYWRDKEEAEYLKRRATWIAQTSGQKGSKKAKEKKESSVMAKPEMNDILTSEISFQDADSEGVAAMEQRIQQLTQTLSRVGRVLDRHRESLLESDLSVVTDSKSLRARVQPPLAVFPDEKVVAWMWKSPHGAVESLLRQAEKAPCVRPALIERFRDVKARYAFLDAWAEYSSSPYDTAKARRQLKQALLDFRTLILDELKDMSKEFRRVKAEQNVVPRAWTGPGMQGDDRLPVDVDSRSNRKIADPLEQHEMEIIEQAEDSSSLANMEAGADIPLVVADVVAHLVDTIEKRWNDTATTFESAETITGDAIETNSRQPCIKDGFSESNSAPWVSHYNERFTLEAAADLLLLYANTSNFFVLNPYKQLQSTPIEVYARELGNSVPRSVVDSGLDQGDAANAPDGRSNLLLVQETNINEAPRKESKNETSLCQPDDIVSHVSIRYQSDYVLSQLLQWYNGGIGQKAGLPDLLGCAVLPTMECCWSSVLLSKSRLKAEKKTTYDSKIRRCLVEWLQDPYQRGNPWPEEIRQAFQSTCVPSASNPSEDLVVFGSPIIDFLVTGDETGIHNILDGLDADDKVKSKLSSDALLTSVDRGRPAQAVSNWVQCENPHCLKWRKIPWHVDIDLLPERFFCHDNKWNPSANTCDALEDDWDDKDALVDETGKVEGSPVRKRNKGSLSPDSPKNFRIGARFDVLREGKKKFCVGEVMKVDFSGKVKRVMFHFPKLLPKFDEWIEYGSHRIAALYTNVNPPKTASSTEGNRNVGQSKKGVAVKTSRCKVKIGTTKKMEESKRQKEETSLKPSSKGRKVAINGAKTLSTADEQVDEIRPSQGVRKRNMKDGSKGKIKEKRTKSKMNKLDNDGSSHVEQEIVECLTMGRREHAELNRLCPMNTIPDSVEINPEETVHGALNVTGEKTHKRKIEDFSNGKIRKRKTGDTAKQKTKPLRSVSKIKVKNQGTSDRSCRAAAVVGCLTMGTTEFTVQASQDTDTGALYLNGVRPVVDCGAERLSHPPLSSECEPGDWSTSMPYWSATSMPDCVDMAPYSNAKTADLRDDSQEFGFTPHCHDRATTMTANFRTTLPSDVAPDSQCLRPKSFAPFLGQGSPADGGAHSTSEDFETMAEHALDLLRLSSPTVRRIPSAMPFETCHRQSNGLVAPCANAPAPLLQEPFNGQAPSRIAFMGPRLVATCVNPPYPRHHEFNGHAPRGHVTFNGLCNEEHQARSLPNTAWVPRPVMWTEMDSSGIECPSPTGDHTS